MPSDKQHASVVIRQVLVTTPGGEQTLLVQVDIDCDACGVTQGVVYGHHLRTLHKALGMVIEAHPDLCGDLGEIKERTQFRGRHVPGSERLN
jgi:hypothetical protein